MQGGGGNQFKLGSDLEQSLQVSQTEKDKYRMTRFYPHGIVSDAFSDQLTQTLQREGKRFVSDFKKVIGVI